METIYLPTHESPISEAETEAFLDALKRGERNHQIHVNGRPAMVTAVYDSGGKVSMLYSNSSDISGSIPVTDRPGEETPRDEKYFPTRYVSNPTWRRFEGIAAYKFIDSPGVAAHHETRVVEALG